ncbi:iron ABC transporter ATP-binding protein, partial [Escherichia coli]
ERGDTGPVGCNQVNHLIPTRVLVKGGEITCKMLK